MKGKECWSIKGNIHFMHMLRSLTMSNLLCWRWYKKKKKKKNKHSPKVNKRNMSKMVRVACQFFPCPTSHAPDFAQGPTINNFTFFNVLFNSFANSRNYFFSNFQDKYRNSISNQHIREAKFKKSNSIS